MRSAAGTGTPPPGIPAGGAIGAVGSPGRPPSAPKAVTAAEATTPASKPSHALLMHLHDFRRRPAREALEGRVERRHQEEREERRHREAADDGARQREV